MEDQDDFPPIPTETLEAEASDATDPEAWVDEEKGYVTDVDPTMQVMEDGDYPDDDEWTEGLA